MSNPLSRLLSDRHRALKVGLLILAAAGLAAWSAWGFNADPVQWQRAAAWRADPEGHQGQRVWISLVHVIGLADEGRTARVTVGPEMIPLTLLLPRPVRLGQRLDAAGILTDRLTIRVTTLRVHTGSRVLKVGLSLAAALIALALMAAAFRFNPQANQMLQLRNPTGGRD